MVVGDRRDTLSTPEAAEFEVSRLLSVKDTIAYIVLPDCDAGII